MPNARLLLLLLQRRGLKINITSASYERMGLGWKDGIHFCMIGTKWKQTMEDIPIGLHQILASKCHVWGLEAYLGEIYGKPTAAGATVDFRNSSIRFSAWIYLMRTTSLFAAVKMCHIINQWGLTWLSTESVGRLSSSIQKICCLADMIPQFFVKTYLFLIPFWYFPNEDSDMMIINERDRGKSSTTKIQKINKQIQKERKNALFRKNAPSWKKLKKKPLKKKKTQKSYMTSVWQCELYTLPVLSL